MLVPNSFLIARTISCCVISRSRPRMLPSTSRRYRIFSPSFMSIFVLQIAITILLIAISVKSVACEFLLRGYVSDTKMVIHRGAAEHTEGDQSGLRVLRVSVVKLGFPHAGTAKESTGCFRRCARLLIRHLRAVRASHRAAQSCTA